MKNVAGVGSENGYYGYYLYDSKGNVSFYEVGRDVNLIGVFCNIETEEIFLEVEYEYDGIVSTQRFSRDDLTNKGLLKFAKYGMDVYDKGVDCLVSHLREQESMFLQNNNAKLLHSSIGWLDISRNGQLERMYFHDKCRQLRSSYDGDLDIKPRGSFKDWKNDVENLILGNAPIETVVVIALSAVLFGYYRGVKDVTNAVVHIGGDSTSGKSSALEAGIATTGNPSLQAEGLCKSWAATDNAVIDSLDSLFGVPVGRDELSLNESKNLSQLIYQLSMGRSRERLGKNCESVATKFFTTVLLSTGETGILSRCSGNTGLNIRVIELKVQDSERSSWSLDSEHAEAIKNASRKHYGTACVELASIIESMAEEELEDYFQRCRRMYLEKTETTRFSQRVSTMYALFLMAAELMRDKLGVNFDVGAILDFLLRNEAEMSKDFVRDLGLRFYDDFSEYIWRERRHFVEKALYSKANLLKTTKETSNHQVWGVLTECSKLEKVILGKKVLYEVTVRKNRFHEIVEELGYEDTRNILNDLRSKKLLNTEGDRYISNRMVDSQVKEKVYIFWMLSEPEEIDTTDKELREILDKETKERIEKNRKRRAELVGTGNATGTKRELKGKESPRNL